MLVNFILGFYGCLPSHAGPGLAACALPTTMLVNSVHNICLLIMAIACLLSKKTTRKKSQLNGKMGKQTRTIQVHGDHRSGERQGLVKRLGSFAIPLGALFSLFRCVLFFSFPLFFIFSEAFPIPPCCWPAL